MNSKIELLKLRYIGNIPNEIEYINPLENDYPNFETYLTIVKNQTVTIKYNYDIIKNFLNNLIDDGRLLKNNLHCHNIDKNDHNLYFMDIEIHKVVDLLKIYKYNINEADEIESIINYIETNEISFKTFSVCLKQIKNGVELNEKWEVKNKDNELIEIKCLTRSDFNNEDEPNWKFKSIMEGISK